MRDPFAYQGDATRHYFEGWYFKNVAPGGIAYSFIPGVSFDDTGAGHAFVQVIRGSDGATAYERFAFDDFRASRDSFEVRIGANTFSRAGLEVDLPAFGGIRGRLEYRDTRALPRAIMRPGIMGWYRRVPFMECYHEVGSVGHAVSGSLTVGGQEVDFTGGRGYLEKDWGTSMPRAWVWIQCNGFSDPDLSIMISVARIPWLGRTFTGFLGFVARRDSILQFGTYSGARVTRLETPDTRVLLEIRAGEATILVEGTRSHTGVLAAPVAGAMDRRIAESLDGTVHLTVNGGDGARVARVDPIDDVGHAAGIELVGDVASLAPSARGR